MIIEFQLWKSPNYITAKNGETYALSDLEDKEFEDYLVKYVLAIRNRRDEMIKFHKKGEKK